MGHQGTLHYTDFILTLCPGETVITARDNELIAADLSSPSSTVLVNYTLPGRAPVLISSQEDIMVCPDRAGLSLMVRRRGGGKYVESQVLARHDMIVNSLVMREDLLLSAGWDCRVVIWVGRSLLSLKPTEPML